MVQPADLQRKVFPLTQTAFPVILCIKVSGVGIPEPEEQLFMIVGLYAQMMMGCQILRNLAHIIQIRAIMIQMETLWEMEMRYFLA